MDTSHPLLSPMKDTDHRTVGTVEVDVARLGEVRVKRMIYPPGFSWEKDLSSVMGSKLCTHSHVGFMAHGQINVRYADGCVEEFKAPQFVAVQPGHEGWVVGDEPAVLIEVDFGSDTASRMGLPDKHHHDAKPQP